MTLGADFTPPKKKKEKAGPYRSQSRNPKIRKKATKSEHGKVRVKPKSPSSAITQPVSSKFSKGYSNKSKVGNPDGGIPIGKVLDYLRNPNEKITGDSSGRKFAEDEAKTALKAVKDSLERAKSGEGHLRTPSSAQLQTALTAASVAGGGAGVKAGEKAVVKAVDAASDASWAKNAVKAVAKGAKEAPKRKVTKIKTAPKRAATKVKETPARVRTAPARAKKAATTSEGRRAVAKGTGKKAAQHPIRSFAGAGVLANQSGADIPGLKQAGAFLEGTVSADPIKSAKTTARAVPAIVTGPAALVGSAASSVIHGTPDPLVKEAKKQGEGLIDIGGKLLSGDPETVKKATEDEVGYSFVAPMPALSRLGKTRAWKKGRGRVREKVAGKRAATRAKRRAEIRAYQEGTGPKPKKNIRHAVIDRSTGEEYVLRRTGKRINNRRARVNTANRIPTWKAKGEREAAAASREVVNEVRKSKLSHGEHNIADTLGTVAQYGISRNWSKAKRQLDEIEASIIGPWKNKKGGFEADQINVNTINDLRNIRWLRDHPEAFTDKHFWNAVDAYKRQSKEIESSKRKTDLALGDVYGVARPEERLEAGVTIPGRTREVERAISEPISEANRLAAAKALARRERSATRAKRRSEGRVARRRAKTGGYDPSPEAMRERDWYHGSPNGGLDRGSLDSYGTSPTNLFGQGVYLTTKPNVARSYSKLNKQGWNRSPTVYKAKIDPKGVLDLEGDVDPRFVDILDRAISEAGKWKGEDLGTEFRAALRSSTGASKPGFVFKNKNAYRAYEATLSRFAEAHGIPASELVDVQAALTWRLREAGIDVLTHRGGHGMGGLGDHQVAIILDPADMGGHGKGSPVSAFADRAYPPVRGPLPHPLSKVPEARTKVVKDSAPVKVRAPFYKQPETVQRKQAELSDLRKDAKRLEAEITKLSPKDRARAKAVGAEIRSRADKLEFELRGKREAAASLGRSLSDARLGYKQATKDYHRDVRNTRAEKGFEPSAYVKDTRPGGEVGVSAAHTARSSQSQRMADAAQTYRGQVFNRRFEDVVNQSISVPRMKQAMHDATSEWVDTYKTSVAGKDYVTSDEIQRAVNRGELDPSQFEAFDAQHFKQAILDPRKTIDDVGNEVSGSIRSLKGEILGRANDPGKKYILVPKEAALEFVHQFEPPKGGMKVVGDANRLFTRVILGYSPAWALSQIIAEGIPAAVSIGANPLRYARVAKYMMRENKRLSRKDKAAIDAMAGESPGVTPHPMTSFRPDTNKLASRFFRLSNRNRLGRALLSTASGSALGVFDRWKGGKYRKAVAAAKADKELNSFVNSLSGLMRGQRSIVEAIKGKSLDEQMAYISKHPAEAAKLEGYLNNVMGNWRALTRHEAKFAPFIAFYPFVRYSLRWIFWSFPKEHPIKAQILYFLGQQNANELEKLLGGPPANPIDYTFPVYTNSQGANSVMPGGQRFAPGMNALTTAVGKGRIENLLTALNPPIGMAVTAISGVDPFTGEKVANTPGEHGLLALNQLLSMGAPLRMQIPGVGKSARELATEAAGDEPPSDISKAFRGMDPNRDARSFYNPLAPQSVPRYRDSVKLSKALDESGGEPRLGEDLLTQAVLAARNGNRRLVKELIAKRKSSEKASDEISRLVREYVADPQKFAKFTKADWKVVNEITGEMVIPVEPKKKAKLKGPGIGGGGGSGIGGPSSSGGIGGPGSGGGIGGVPLGGGIGGSR